MTDPKVYGQLILTFKFLIRITSKTGAGTLKTRICGSSRKSSKKINFFQIVYLDLKFFIANWRLLQSIPHIPQRFSIGFMSRLRVVQFIKVTSCCLNHCNVSSSENGGMVLLVYSFAPFSSNFPNESNCISNLLPIIIGIFLTIQKKKYGLFHHKKMQHTKIAKLLVVVY